MPLAGIIVNRVGGAQHGAWLTDAIARVGLPVLGLIPAMAGLAVPERHLGLFTAAERPEAARRFIDHAAEVVAAHIDLEALWALARSAPELGAGDAFEPAQPTSSSVRLAVARDEAFCFYYEDNLDLLRQAGAEIVPFSPIRDECLPDDVCGVYLGGGYPELYAPQLAANTSLRRDLLTYHRRGLPMYAECGGLMVLTEGIDLDTGSHDLVGALPGRSTMARGLTMGYREVEVARPGLLGDAGQRLRGHEFHYSAWTPDREHEAYRLATRGPGAATRFEGYAVGRLLASYVHVHFGQDPALPERLVSACRRHQPEQTARVESMSARTLMFMGTDASSASRCWSPGSAAPSPIAASASRRSSRRTCPTMPPSPPTMARSAAPRPCRPWPAASSRLTAMNPVLLKPEHETGAQLIVRGQRIGSVPAGIAWKKRKAKLWAAVTGALERLRDAYDLVLIEGAGSASEVNLRSTDIANFGFAQAIGAPVVLIGDIDRGGVIASLVGTFAVIDPADAALIKATLVNKFRGDPALFADGRDFIAERTGVPVPRLPCPFSPDANGCRPRTLLALETRQEPGGPYRHRRAAVCRASPTSTTSIRFAPSRA